ncbi:MAG: alpha-galactosidase [Prevotellaceae bacterium]|nr:alpha-galactosidase [Prevotellaceae bacterium]
MKTKWLMSVAGAALMLFLAGCGREEKAAPGTMNGTAPMMGWSSWNANHININETLLKATADSMVSLGLKDVGYEWVNIDDGYFNGRDAKGHLQVNAKFPNGMKVIADYIRSKGLHPGIYSEIGQHTCGSVGDNDAAGKNSGLYGHEEQDLRLFFDTWGYEFIKVDYCGGLRQGLNEEVTYTNVANIIRSLERELGRKLRYNICRWGFPGTWAAGIAGSWRISGDIADNFASLKYIIDLNTYLAPYASPGHYNDMDMLQLGRGLTPDEEKTHFGIWAIMSSPLIIGCNFEGIRQSTLDILKNTEIIAVNQDDLGLQAELVAKNEDGHVFAKPIETAHGKVRAVALFNAGNAEKVIRVAFADIQLSEKAKVRDLWAHTDLGEFTGYYETLVPAHGTAMLRIEGKAAIDKLRYEGEYAYMNKFTTINQAENARFQKVTNVPVSGGYVMGWLGNSSDNWAEYRDVYLSKGGTYTFKLYYICGENRDVSLIVNGREYRLENLNSGGNTCATAKIDIELRAGSNVIRLANSTTWAPDIDKFELIPKN